LALEAVAGVVEAGVVALSPLSPSPLVLVWLVQRGRLVRPVRRVPF
jgi:hypothetical protein